MTKKRKVWNQITFWTGFIGFYLALSAASALIIYELIKGFILLWR